MENNEEIIELCGNISRKCGELLKNNGATRYVCSAAKGITNEFNIDGGKFSLFRTLFDDLLVMTAYIGDKKGTISINKFDEESINEAVKNCIAATEAAEPDSAWEIAPKHENRTFVKGSPECDTDKLFMRTKEYLEDLKKDFPLIMPEQVITSHTKKIGFYVNSSGTEFATIAGNYTLSSMFSAHDGDRSSSFFSDGGIMDNLDTKFVDFGTMRDSLEKVQKQIETEAPDGKFVGTLIAPPSILSDFLGSIIDDFTGDTAILEGTSIWLDSLGKQVADSRLTVKIAPKDPRIVCGQDFTPEGYIAEDYYVIKDGVLENFTLSSYVANKTGKKRAPNTSSNFIVGTGDVPLAEMIKGVKKGLLAGRFSGGDPAGNGDFSGVAKNSFLIEDGKITKAVSETMISGNLADMLKNITHISTESYADGGDVLPVIQFEGITVSGK